MTPRMSDVELADRIFRARLAALRPEVVNPDVLALAQLADLVDEYFRALYRYNVSTDVERSTARAALLASESALTDAVRVGGMARLANAVGRLGAEHDPPPGWETRVLASVDRPPWWQRARQWLTRRSSR